ADEKAVGDAINWMKEQVVYTVTLFNGAPIAVTPPNFVELEVVETDPGVRGDTSGGGNKPAKLVTGAVVKVPLFINVGDVLRGETRASDCVGRVGSGPGRMQYGTPGLRPRFAFCGQPFRYPVQRRAGPSPRSIP